MKRIILLSAFILCYVAINIEVNATNVTRQEKIQKENNTFNWGDYPLYKDALLKTLEYNLDDWLNEAKFEGRTKKQVRQYVGQYIKLIREDNLYYQNGSYIDRTGKLTNKKTGTDYPGIAVNYITTIVKEMIQKGMYYKQ
ncbi:hypothetical protein [Bacteroides sp. 519]|uniref:hypothetical protein n=1 Tax=Bacteroides sp. 519 TaxID=2302937 RepID=UPI0013D1C695|nr:hypothetical protein [Bacteroides sp. 519]NDV57161.1 hypothetical protein [Bacteroides sp. 519]